MHAGDQTVGKENSGNKTVCLWFTRHTSSTALTSLQEKKKNSNSCQPYRATAVFITQKEAALILLLQRNHQIDFPYHTEKLLSQKKRKSSFEPAIQISKSLQAAANTQQSWGCLALLLSWPPTHQSSTNRKENGHGSEHHTGLNAVTQNEHSWVLNDCRPPEETIQTKPPLSKQMRTRKLTNTGLQERSPQERKRKCTGLPLSLHVLLRALC